MVDFYNDFLRSERDLKRYLAVGRNKEELFSLIQRAVEEHPYIFANVINVPKLQPKVLVNDQT